jgi:hypothetical protein
VQKLALLARTDVAAPFALFEDSPPQAANNNALAKAILRIKEIFIANSRRLSELSFI